jgi:HTH-type transcriptional regulator, repressor for puuD
MESTIISRSSTWPWVASERNGDAKVTPNPKATILRIEDIPQFHWGDGVITTPLVGWEQAPDTVFTSGLTSFPPGLSVPMHSHNCGEQVTVLEGDAALEVDGETTPLRKHDTTYIPAGKSHRFNNVGASPLLVLWVCGAQQVTRTFTETGKTVNRLAPRDTANLA